MIDVELIKELELSYQTACEYLSLTKNKKIKMPRDRKAIEYWEGQKYAYDRAIYLAEHYYKEIEQ